MKNIALSIFSLFIVLECFSQTDEKRFALIIGNSNYKEYPLKMPENDAKAIALELQKYGFNVTLQTNISRDNFINEISNFKNILSEKNSVALFYYAGHAIQIDDEGFLIPVDAKIRKEEDIEQEAINLKSIINSIDSAQNHLNILILDVIPKIPYKRYFKEKRPSFLNPIISPKNSIIVYTYLSSLCCDDYRNSLYIQEFINAIHTPNLNIHEFFKTVRRNVYQLSNKKQVPWENSSVEFDFYFNKTENK